MDMDSLLRVLRTGRARVPAAVTAGIVISQLVVGQASAHVPNPGAAQLYDNSPVVTLSYKWGGSPPAWLTGAAQTALETDYPNRAFNNSRMPVFAFSATGSGQVVYSSAALSPCGTGNPDWLQCATGGGGTSWRIYLRNFGASGKTSWYWYQQTNTCPAGKTCWDVRRALMHEILHITMAASHDAQGESNTVMASTTPWSPNVGWNTHHIQRCDEAAAQLKYGVVNSAGVIADCFDDIAGHGVNGLISVATTSATSYAGCTGQGVSAAGRLAIKTTANYERLSNLPLTNRTVYFDRKLHSATTWTLNYLSAVASNVAGNNWTRNLGAPASGTYDFRVHYGGEAGVDPSNQPIFTVLWSTAC
jgi:hypothetical protein